MSFSLVCPKCGAPSGPSVGVCPYCKSVFAPRGGKESPTVKAIRSHYEKGELEQALSLATLAEKEKPSLAESASFALLYAQILLESEAPSSKMRSLLQKALLAHPEEAGLLEYMEIVNAKAGFSHEREDGGETALRSVLRRSPRNPHAAFLLGSHLFWTHNDTQAGVVFLESAVKNRPNFLRALACLGALYGKIGAWPQAAKIFQRCVALEKNPEMKKFFREAASKQKLP